MNKYNSPILLNVEMKVFAIFFYHIISYQLRELLPKLSGFVNVVNVFFNTYIYISVFLISEHLSVHHPLVSPP